MAISLLQFQQQTVEPMRKGIVQAITNESLFLRRLNFIPVDGFAYRYNRQQTLGGIAFRNLNASYTPDQGVINPMVETLAIFGGEVRTDRQLVNKQGDVARANAITAKVKRAGLFFDKYVITGDPGSDATQFYGLKPRLTGAQFQDNTGSALTLAMLNLLLDSVVGTNTQKVLVCNKAARRAITNLILAAAGGAGVRDVGPQATSYDGAPIEVLDEDGDEAAIISGGTGADSDIYCIRLGSTSDGEYVQGLIGANMIEQVAVGLLGTYYSDIVEANMGLAVFHGRAAARLKATI